MFKIYVICSLVLNEKTTAKLNSALPFTALNLQWTDVLLSMICHCICNVRMHVVVPDHYKCFTSSSSITILLLSVL